MWYNTILKREFENLIKIIHKEIWRQIVINTEILLKSYVTETLVYLNSNANKIVYFLNKKILTQLFLIIRSGTVLNLEKCIYFEWVRLYRFVILFILILHCKRELFYGR
jgi:hypothetical protein